MPGQRDSAIQYLKNNETKLLFELMNFLSIPSISTDPDKRDSMAQAAGWLAEKLIDLDFHKVDIHPTKGAPIVFGEYRSPYPSAKTVLIYGHYDVQPADPLDLWRSDPFKAMIEGDLLIARGASDMKGQLMAVLAALESLLSCGSINANIKLIIEGEEEIGSPNLESFILENKELLACDIILNTDTGMLNPSVPTITYGLRGIAYFEIRILGPSRDLHSGAYGGIIHNPAQVLCEIIAGLHDVNGKVTLPGFYEKVVPLSDHERAELARIPIDDSIFKKQTGVSGFWGEAGYTNIERIGARPTLEVHGLFSGYTGQGSKTIIPAFAMAKISMRLVPNQNPVEINRMLHRYLKENVPNTVTYEVVSLNSGEPSLSPLDTPAVQAMENALTHVWGIKPIYKREGGSIPVTAIFQKILRSESVLTGFGLPDDNIHSPNEHLHLPTWRRGSEAIIHFISNISEFQD